MHADLKDFLQRYPDTQMLELLAVDMNGIPRCKRLHRSEFDSFFAGKQKCLASLPLVNTAGEFRDEVDERLIAGEPDVLLLPVSGSLAPIPWLDSPTAQVFARFCELDGSPAWMDPRTILSRVVERLAADDLHPVIATEMEFYLLEEGEGGAPKPKTSRVPGTSMSQTGVQFSLPEELWDNEDFLEDVRIACELQSVPMTTVHAEFGSGQFEINTRHVDDPLLACDHAVLLKRIVKGVARRQGSAACFMAKPFAGQTGNGLHIHVSLYNGAGENLFHDPASEAVPAISDTMRHAVGGLADTMADAMAIFAPNANSYRRLEPGNYVPLSPLWGYNHRDMALRLPVAGAKDTRIEHRVAGADANPYLVVAAILAGIHHGITQDCDPGPMVEEGTALADYPCTLPRRWDAALDAFEASTVLHDYLGADYCSAFASMRRAENEAYHAQIPELDYQWYLRAV